MYAPPSMFGLSVGCEGGGVAGELRRVVETVQSPNWVHWLL